MFYSLFILFAKILIKSRYNLNKCFAFLSIFLIKLNFKYKYILQWNEQKECFKAIEDLFMKYLINYLLQCFVLYITTHFGLNYRQNHSCIRR